MPRCSCREAFCPHVGSFPEPEEPQEGIYRKFEVKRTDGTSGHGGKHQKCDYFVLDWIHDPYAVIAARAYADACEKIHPELAADLRRRADRAERERIA